MKPHTIFGVIALASCGISPVIDAQESGKPQLQLVALKCINGQDTLNDDQPIVNVNGNQYLGPTTVASGGTISLAQVVGLRLPTPSRSLDWIDSYSQTSTRATWSKRIGGMWARESMWSTSRIGRPSPSGTTS